MYDSFRINYETFRKMLHEEKDWRKNMLKAVGLASSKQKSRLPVQTGILLFINLEQVDRMMYDQLRLTAHFHISFQVAFLP